MFILSIDRQFLMNHSHLPAGEFIKHVVEEAKVQLCNFCNLLALQSLMQWCRFNPPEDFTPFILADGLYYNNALENAASAMEIAAIEGKNSALLASRHLLKINTSTEILQTPKFEL